MDENASRYGNFRRILFATDFSANADLAFGFAVDAAVRNTGSTLYLLHVVPEPDAHFWKGYIYESDQDPDAKARADIDARIDATYRPRVPAGLDFRCVFRVGSPSQQILAFAHSEQVDLMVLGRQGQGAVSRLFFGNVATRVARNAACPVLIVPMAFARRSRSQPA